MQATMVITAPGPGLIYINGHFAGEAGPDLPLMRPIAPTGAVYIEYHPLMSAYRGLARRLVFSGGVPLPSSAGEAEEMQIVLWPCGATEIELMPPESDPPSPVVFEAGGRSFVIDGKGRLTWADRVLAQLPEGAQIPRYHLMRCGAVLTGACRDGMYLLSGDAQFETVNGFLTARQLETEPDGRIRAVIHRDDLVGHASLESWRLEEEGLRMVAAEPAWAQGAPRWPQTGAETARAAVEAQMEGLTAEAEGYLSPALRQSNPLAALAERCDLITEMKYALPAGRPCLAMLRLEDDGLARAEPLYYRVSASGGPQGPYQIEQLETK